MLENRMASGTKSGIWNAGQPSHGSEPVGIFYVMEYLLHATDADTD